VCTGAWDFSSPGADFFLNCVRFLLAHSSSLSRRNRFEESQILLALLRDQVLLVVVCLNSCSEDLNPGSSHSFKLIRIGYVLVDLVIV